MNRVFLASAIVGVMLSPPVSAQSARDYISAVGSSTLFPFTSTAAEQFGRGSRFKAPKVEATGTGGGMKLFCAGVGVSHPDIVNASRRMKASELADCRKNGVAEVIEVRIGFDGIVLANAKASPVYRLSRKDIFLALARQVPDPAGGGKLIANPYRTWKQVNPALPAIQIEVLGPPPTSGTRDSFVELVMEYGCDEIGSLKALKSTDERQHKQVCSTVREDGAFIEAGENDNLIVQKLVANPKALGIFGYSFLEANPNTLHGSVIDDVKPEFEQIQSGDYPVSRALFVYFKKAHVGVIPGLREFIAEFTSDKAIGEDGYLVDKGLIPAPRAERERTRRDAAALLALKSL